VSLLSRRSVLQTAAKGMAAASLGSAWWHATVAWAQAPAGGGRATQDLGGGMHVLTLGATNVLAMTDADGVALVDGAPRGQHDVLADMLATLPRTGRVHTLLNSHWHPEQTGSNEAFGKAGATIIAQQNTKLWLTTDVTWPWNNETVQPLPKEALPNNTFYSHAELEIGGRHAKCGHLPDCPHTDGDMYVFFPSENVLSVGDAVWGAGWPSIDWWTGGWIGGIVGGLDALSTVANEGTRIVPSRGPVLTHADLESHYQMYSTIWERLAKTLYSGGGPDDAVAAKPTQEFDAKMGPSEPFVRRAFESLWAYLSPDA
jgi:cyclase